MAMSQHAKHAGAVALAALRSFAPPEAVCMWCAGVERAQPVVCGTGEFYRFKRVSRVLWEYWEVYIYFTFVILLIFKTLYEYSEIMFCRNLFIPRNLEIL